MGAEFFGHAQRQFHGHQAGSGEHDLTADQVFTDDIAKLFSNIVSLAEKAGKHVELMVVPGFNPAWAIMETAQRLQSSVIVMGLSAKMAMDEQAKAYGNAWERLPEPRPQLSLQIIDPDSGRELGPGESGDETPTGCANHHGGSHCARARQG